MRGYILFDFDGTISLFRTGWQEVMEKVMWHFIREVLPQDDNQSLSSQWLKQINDYIQQSTGIQTIYQMQWLQREIMSLNAQKARSIWEYKEAYRAALKTLIQGRLDDVATRKADPTQYLVTGAKDLLMRLRDLGFMLFLASGTDDADVVKEAQLLGISTFFTSICGTPDRSMENPKLEMMKKILAMFSDHETIGAVIGDGPVEMQLGREYRLITIGVASDDGEGNYNNSKKRERLRSCGAQLVVDDLSDIESITAVLTRGLYQ